MIGIYLRSRTIVRITTTSVAVSTTRRRITLKVMIVTLPLLPLVGLDSSLGAVHTYEDIGEVEHAAQH